MKIRKTCALPGLVPLLMLLPVAGGAQVPVDDDGNVIDSYTGGTYERFSTEPATGEEGIPLLAPADLEEIVGPIALYPDELLAVVLPASTYPLQIVQAARFLEDLEADPALEPDSGWDDSIVALINYPEALALLNEDLDWTWRLGEAVVAQEAEVLVAVREFRDRAYAAGNLKSDGYQTVSRDEGVIEIMPVTREIMYVPYYEPERVVHYQSSPVYHYYPQPCPVYYYPYPAGYAFPRHRFWGVTTAFAIGWRSDHLRVFHHSYSGHPYFGVRYWDRWWYRRPPISVHNNVYVNKSVTVTTNRYTSGDTWQPNRGARLRYSDQRITRNTVPRNRRSDAPLAATHRTIGQRNTLNRRQHESVVPARRDNAVERRGAIVAQRENTVQPRGIAGVTRQPPTSRRSGNQAHQRVAVVDSRRRQVTRQPAPRPSANTARQTPPAQTSERSSQPRSGRPAQSTERRSRAVESGDRRSQGSARKNSAVRDRSQRR